MATPTSNNSNCTIGIHSEWSYFTDNWTPKTNWKNGMKSIRMKQFHHNRSEQMKYLRSKIPVMEMRLCTKDLLLSVWMSKSSFAARVGYFIFLVATEMIWGKNEERINTSNAQPQPVFLYHLNDLRNCFISWKWRATLRRSASNGRKEHSNLIYRFGKNKQTMNETYLSLLETIVPKIFCPHFPLRMRRVKIFRRSSGVYWQYYELPQVFECRWVHFSVNDQQIEYMACCLVFVLNA